MCEYVEDSKEEMEPTLDTGGTVMLCQALYQSIKEEEWTEMHETSKDVTEMIGVKKAGQKVAGVGEVAWRKTSKESYFSAKVEQCLQQKVGTAGIPLVGEECGHTRIVEDVCRQTSRSACVRRIRAVHEDRVVSPCQAALV